MWASLYCAPAFGGFDLGQWPGALRAGFLLRWIPERVLAFRVAVTGVEDFAVAALLLCHLTLFALRAVDVEGLGLFQRLDVLAPWVGAAGQEFAVAAGLDQHASSALVTFLVRHHGFFCGLPVT